MDVFVVAGGVVVLVVEEVLSVVVVVGAATGIAGEVFEIWDKGYKVKKKNTFFFSKPL